MARADDFRSLGEDIANAYDNRITMIKELKSEVSELLNGFASKDRERARGNKEIRAEVSRLLTGFKQEAKERAKEIAEILSNERKMLEGFHKEQAEASAAFEELVAKMAAKRGIQNHPRAY